jgi:uncharacterized protein
MKTLALKIPAQFRLSAPPPSPRSREIAVRFGLAQEDPSAPLPLLRFRIRFPSITLICGPSGSGKSTLLRRIAPALPTRSALLSRVPLPQGRAVIDCFSANLDDTLALLSRAGLAEPRLWLRPPAWLSQGEQFRFRLARLMASPAPILLADEFAALLDRVTARAVAWQFARFLRAAGRAAIVATSHEDLAEDLQPDSIIHLPATCLQDGQRNLTTKTRRHEEPRKSSTDEHE